MYLSPVLYQEKFSNCATGHKLEIEQFFRVAVFFSPYYQQNTDSPMNKHKQAPHNPHPDDIQKAPRDKPKQAKQGRQGKARQRKATQGKATQGRQGKARQDKTKQAWPASSLFSLTFGRRQFSRQKRRQGNGQRRYFHNRPAFFGVSMPLWPYYAGFSVGGWSVKGSKPSRPLLT